MNKNIAVIRGDGIGPEIVEQALCVLDRVAELYGHTFTYTDVDMGGCAIDKWGDPLPEEMLQKCLASDSVLLGAVGGNKWNSVPGHLRPEKGLLRLRAGMGVYSNNRPAKIWPQLASASPLKSDIVEKGIDFIIVRELIGGIYFGEHKTETKDAQQVATDILTYSEKEIERIGRIGFETAQKRSGRLCSVEKSNVLDSSRLWKAVMHRLAEEYPDVELTDMLVDNCAMQIVKNPAQFDVIVTENMFGDILSDETSMITGSIGMIPSSSLGSSSCGLYEPIHGSAPDIAGTDAANPIGTILSAAMMLRFSFDMSAEAECIENAVSALLDKGYRTADITPSDPAEAEKCKKIGCKECGSIITSLLKKA
ncbi:MAG: 3-isopropylmalate dehydrogenase [Oscillospiraceae bacterium]|nr:3-isopropylmalate dehydrogenase [Oscillospiraceae bacterium]